MSGRAFKFRVNRIEDTDPSVARVDVSLFAGKDRDHLQLCGHLMLDLEEYKVMRQLMGLSLHKLPGVEVIHHDEPIVEYWNRRQDGS